MKAYKLRLILLLMLGTIFTSCEQEKMEEMNMAALPEPAKYLALGDSYTLGDGVTTTERWPVQLSGLLDKAQLPVGEPLVLAESDWTTGDLLSYMRSVNIPNDYSLISLMIGRNNQAQGRSQQEFRTEFRSLVNISIQLAQKDPKNVVVLTIPNWGVTPAANGQDRNKITTQIAQFNKIIEEEAKQANVTVVDVNDLSLQVVQTPSLLASDQLHYSGSMYQQWAQRVLPSAQTVLAN